MTSEQIKNKVEEILKGSTKNQVKAIIIKAYKENQKEIGILTLKYFRNRFGNVEGDSFFEELKSYALSHR